MSEPQKKRKKKLSFESNNTLSACYGTLGELLLKLRTSFVDEDGDEVVGVVSEDDMEQLFSGMSLQDLDNISLERGPDLVLLLDKTAVLRNLSASRGNSEFWTSNALCTHLNMLKEFVTLNQAGARLWINAFFFRARAILSETDAGSDMATVLSLEQHVNVTVNPSTDLSGFIDYTALRGPKNIAKTFLTAPVLKVKRNKEGLTLFVNEAKKFDVPLEDFIPQTVAEMYACAKALDKSVVRGALTNGNYWIFIIVRLKGDGATYHKTATRFSLLGYPNPRLSIQTPPWKSSKKMLVTCWQASLCIG
ncbi:hypothetical protein CVT26_012952 [Gymnopilus dilepis]|uniref:Uncharacterized protein n=1 Tax=Gymnopilus dilepis TaxID=231916 RepID=A0A409WVF0_9AGAR|nr:hypothetical protein CVT26_012952 [Gymnopilus dilepis]